MRRAVRLRLVLAVVALLAALPAVPASAAVVPYFADRAAQEAMLSAMTIAPASLRVGSVTYIAYQGTGFDAYVASYDESSGVWAGPYRVGYNPLVLDAHGAPALFLDTDGRLHAVFGGHLSDLKHYRTVTVGGIDRWEQLPVIEPYGTYPQPVELADGRIALFFRGADAGWYMRLSDPTRNSFGAAQQVIAADPQTVWYASFRGGSEGRVHAAFMRLDLNRIWAGGLFCREDAYYMARDAAGIWRNASGTALPSPLTPGSSAQALAVDTGDLAANEISVSEDASGSPCLLYLEGIGAGPEAYEWRYLRRSGGAWVSSGIARTDHYFDSGTFRPLADGSVEALLVTGANGAEGGDDQDYRGRGGRIERWTSADGGSAWECAGPVSPDEGTGISYGDPQFVAGGSAAARAVFTDWSDDETNFWHRIFLWGDDGVVTREVAAAAQRTGGADRIATALAVSRKTFPEGARVVVIATSKDFPDGLSGGPLGHVLGGPVLLTAPEHLSAGVADEIRRLGATRALVLGGTGALRATIDSELRTYAKVSAVERLGGATRYDTAHLVAERMRDPDHPVGTAVLVSGAGWPDAVSAGPLAGVLRCPIVLTDPGFLPGGSAATLESWGTTRTLVVGGTSVVGSVVESAVPGAVRIAGADRYETAAAVAAFGAEEGMLPYRVVLATGLAYPDALVGGVLAARARAPLLLVRPTSLPASAESYLTANAGSVTTIFVMGTWDAVGEGVVASALEAVD